MKKNSKKNTHSKHCKDPNSRKIKENIKDYIITTEKN